MLRQAFQLFLWLQINWTWKRALDRNGFLRQRSVVCGAVREWERKRERENHFWGTGFHFSNLARAKAVWRRYCPIYFLRAWRASSRTMSFEVIFGIFLLTVVAFKWMKPAQKIWLKSWSSRGVIRQVISMMIFLWSLHLDHRHSLVSALRNLLWDLCQRCRIDS